MDFIDVGVSKRFTSDTADSLGSLKGAPCTIKSVDAIPGGNRVTYEWTGTSGTKQTSTMDVMNGEKGDNGTFDSLTPEQKAELKGDPGEKGDDGYSPTITVTDIAGGHRVTITDEAHPTGQSFDVMNGQGGASDAGAVTYDPEENYDEGTVGKALNDELNAINQLGDTAAFKAAILQLAQKVAYIDEYGQNYYDDLHDALYPPVPLASISAVFNQGSAVVYDTNTLDDLKPMLTVTATHEDQTTEVVTNYTLSGTLTVGTSVITVSYRDKTTTFNVVVTEGNIFDPTTAGKNDLFVNTGTNKLAKSSSVQYKSAFIPISPNTTYKIDKDVCGQFRVATTIEEPALNVAITKTQANHSGSSITILSGDSDNWLFITYWADATSSSYDPDLILNSIKVYPL